MKNLLFPLICILLVSCDRFSSDSALAISPKVNSITPEGITSVDSILQPGIKSLDNKELTVFYKIIVDTSDNEELLRKKMYQLQRKLKLSFARQYINFDRLGSLTYIPECEPSIIDRASQKITKNGSSTSLIGIFINDPISKSDMIPTNHVPPTLIRFDFVFSCCPLTSSNKTVALVVETQQSKKVADSMLTQIKKYEKKAYLAIESAYIITEMNEQSDLVSNQ